MVVASVEATSGCASCCCLGSVAPDCPGKTVPASYGRNCGAQDPSRPISSRSKITINVIVSIVVSNAAIQLIPILFERQVMQVPPFGCTS